VARAICLRLLSQRARTRAELADALRRRGVPETAGEVVLARFAEVGLVDDAAVAETFALDQHRRRGLAGRAVAAKLRQRGVDDATVNSAVSSIDPDSEHAAARALVLRKLPSLRHLDPVTQTRRLQGLLARRGYPPCVVTRVVAAAVTGVDSAGGSTDRDDLDGPLDSDIYR
jgi:regulatory protein